MKTIYKASRNKASYITGCFLLLMIFISPGLMFSQNASVSFADNQSNQTDVFVKKFTGKFVSEKVYLNVIVNGITENTFYSVERSIDDSNFETIGVINFLGSTASIDLLYSYVDENPLKVNTYYRLVTYNSLNESLYTEVIVVNADNATTTPSDVSSLQASKN
jgi:hypothetical protein